MGEGQRGGNGNAEPPRLQAPREGQEMENEEEGGIKVEERLAFIYADDTWQRCNTDNDVTFRII